MSDPTPPETTPEEHREAEQRTIIEYAKWMAGEAASGRLAVANPKIAMWVVIGAMMGGYKSDRVI